MRLSSDEFELLCQARNREPLIAEARRARESEERLLGVLKLTSQWRGIGEDPTETFERIATQFRRETGYLRPGKSIPMEMGGGDYDKERRRKWDEWVERKNAELDTAISDAIAEAEQ